ncbi:MAG: hypothetical protein WC243_00325 [Patescibacteria group bacterium]|jgi:hypothetical protein
MTKVLKMKFPKECNGCELCVMEVQRQMGKGGLDGSLIRVLRDEKGLSIDLDPRVNDLEIEKVIKICPKAGFVIEEKEYEGELLS